MQQDRLIQHAGRCRMREISGSENRTRTRPVKVKSHQTEIPWCVEDRCHGNHPASGVEGGGVSFSLFSQRDKNQKLHFHSGDAGAPKSRANANLSSMFWRSGAKNLGKAKKSTSFPWISSVSLRFTAKQMACFLCVSTLYGPHACANRRRQFSPSASILFFQEKFYRKCWRCRGERDLKWPLE